jgi:hypothetical protein
VEFREAVRVIWSGQMSGVEAQAVNLSPTGILIDTPTPTPCPVGSDVLCDVALPRGPRLLRGRVAHKHALPSANMGMGIEFVDLSPRVVAELRDVVDESSEKPQRVKVRFAGTNQIVSARALPTVEGFRLTTALPFLRTASAVDILLSPDAGVSAKGWVSSVALDGSQGDGTPRLLIDVSIGAPENVAAPERRPEPEESDEITEMPPGTADEVPETPLGTSTDKTEIVRVHALPVAAPPRGRGVLAGGIAFMVLALAAALWLSPSGRLPRLSNASPPVAAPKPASSPAPVAIVEPVPPPVASPAPAEPPAEAAAPAPAAAVLPERSAGQAAFIVGLVGSLSGAHRYPLSAPDGVAFNLPHARATLKVGTFRPAVAGLRAVWVRALPGGGTHLRFFFNGSAPAPQVALDADGVRVIAR